MKKIVSVVPPKPEYTGGRRGADLEKSSKNVMGNKEIDIVKEFEKVRDIPYRIPLSLNEKDECCIGKAEMLLDIFKKAGYDARYRVCYFKWSDINLPIEVKSLPHEDKCFHVYLEINIDNEWKIVDATWDKKLKNIFHINEWDGRSNMEISLPSIEIMPIEEGLKFLKHILTPEEITKDLKTSGEFYKGLNEWLEKNRLDK